MNNQIINTIKDNYIKKSFFSVENLNVSIDKRTQILYNCNLKIKKGQIHMIMGPNGSGKSTFAQVISGHPSYILKKGNIIFKEKLISKLLVEDISLLGIFLGFQYPLDLPINFGDFFLEIRSLRPELKSLGLGEWITLLMKIATSLGFVHDDFARNMNEGFSGGERKKTEIFQMLILNPDLIILDEFDSGVDIDALKNLCTHIKKFMTKTKSMILITHHLNITRYIKPDFIHIMKNGSIILTGGSNLSNEIIKKGFIDF